MTILRDNYHVQRLKDCEPTIKFMSKVNNLITAMMLRNFDNGTLTNEKDNKHKKVILKRYTFKYVILEIDRHFVSYYRLFKIS